ncbi:MAG: two-component system sensor histidine kinase NtrB [Thermoanaerobaculia bacterium]
MAQLPSDVRTLIAVRVVAITSLLLAALLIQFTANVVLPIDYLYLTTGLTYALTLVYIGLIRAIPSREANLYIQMVGDIIVETTLVYFTGALDSPFSFLYLVSIITASMMLYRHGGLIIATGAAAAYGTMTLLLYYGIVQPPEETFFTPTTWSSTRLYTNTAMNVAGYYATAFLTSYVSERLRQTYMELSLKQQDLAELRALNQNVVDSIPSGLVTLDQTGALTFVNPAACDILDVTPAQVAGHHIGDLGLFDASEWLRAQAALEGGGIVRGEKFYAGNGRGASIGYAVTPLKTLEGSASGFSIIFQDLTDVKKLESQLRMKDRMAAVGELSAGIAHEIRNPLAAISGSVQVLRSSASLTPQEERLMSIILRESERLNKTIADFLRFVKPQERRDDEFDVAVSLQETLELLSNSQELGPAHRIEWRIVPDSFKINGDPDQIRQVFWNVAKNALQAMPEGGTLRVTASAAGREYRIIFEDEGRGMSEAELRFIFQPFRTRQPSGTGLGMAISYRIIQEHGGRIEVDSRPGSGTTITLALPVRHLAPAVAEA